tara:strand:- start:113 stop:340 length:228 start_codon:yes stop_codon:yes gene_type:complete
MKTVETTDWAILLSTKRSAKVMYNFSTGRFSVKDATSAFSGSKYSGEFRKLVRTHGAVYARRLTRKALRYRGLLA